MRIAALAALALAVAAPAPAQDAAEMEFAMALFTGINPQSISFNREVCGYIVRHPDGRIDSTKHSWGTEASCANLPAPDGVVVLSSWHTHAAWGRGYDGEVPSLIDVEGDMRSGINGWVGTPGGRLWFIDGRTGHLRQVCGRDCLPSDPNFFPEEHGPVEKEYSLEELRARFGEG
ncbi:DUF4329 domain-containing protein [Rhodobacterales bacterium HKCCE3408]|nr:DUF4329 domain-containing protein [Rhodobacterales bacterium HKCCE3408]